MYEFSDAHLFVRRSSVDYIIVLVYVCVIVYKIPNNIIHDVASGFYYKTYSYFINSLI